MGSILENIKSKDHLFIICKDSFKRVILEELYKEKKIIDIQFMSLDEYKRNIFFDYDIKAIKYLIDNYSLSVSNAKEILKNLIYIESNSEYHNEKLDQLVVYKKELENNNLLIKNDIFKNYLKTKDVVVLGYTPLSSFDKNCLVGKTVSIIDEKVIDKEYTINEFKDIEEEVEFVYNSIFDLLNDGVDINDIYLMNVNEEYESYIKRYNTFFDFKVDYSKKDELIGINVVKELLPVLNNSKEDVINYLETINDYSIHKQIVSILNKYAGYEYKEVKELIIDDFKNTFKQKETLKDVVRCKDVLDITNNQDHIFVLGYNDIFVPTKMDTDYIDDNVSKLVNKELTEEENRNTKLRYQVAISKINNCTLTYSKSSPFNSHDISNLFENYRIVRPNTSYDYSIKLNKMKYAFNLDKLLKYNDQDKQIMGTLYNNYNKNDYLTYSNKFNYLTPSQIKELNKISLSYTSMDHYSKCAFRYYLSNILKLDSNENTFYSRYGTLCHEVLKELYLKPDFDFDEVFNEEINKCIENNINICENKMEEFFLDIIKEELRQDIEILRKQKDVSFFDKYYCENEFKVDLNDKQYFKGFIDKLMVKEKDDKAYVSIVDYKTGEGVKFNSKLAKYGLTLQLPVYMWLLLKSNKLDKEIEFVGIYLQHLLRNDHKYNKDKTIDDLKNESILLDGISSDDIDRLNLIDPFILENKTSNIIKSIELKNDNSFYARSKVVSDLGFENFIENVDKTIKTTFSNIECGDFRINPKQIDGKNESCQYCRFENICYHKDKDLMIIDTKEEQ